MKTSALTLFLSLAVFAKLFSQNVGINSTGSAPDASAMLDVSSTTKGFLMPRMTTTERNAIASPATGLTIFNTTIVAYQVNTGTPASPVWSTLGTGSGTVSSVSVTTANGISGVVATPSTTPAITLSLGAITPSSVAATGAMTGSNLSGTNTGDITIGTANGLSLAAQALSLALASTSTTGALSSTDWNTFNNKASAANTWTLGGNSVASAQNIGTTSNFDFPFITNNTEKMRLTSGGNLGLGVSVPTAVLHLKAGTATAGTAPIKFTSGALLTTAEAGAEEFLTDKFYGTITTGAARKEFTLNETSLTSTRVAFANASGRLTDLAAFTYNTNRLSPTYITLGAGAAAAGSAPLIFTSGTSLTTPVAGAMEFTTDNPTFTITTGAARKQFTLNDAALTSGRVPYTTTNGRLIDNASMTYAASRLSPTYLTLAAGTAAAGTAPLVFTSGTNLTTPVAGSVEFNGTHFYGTVGATRYQLDQQTGTTYTGSLGITLSGTDFRNNLITGIAGGQTVIGGTASGNALTLTSTSHVIKGKILFGSSAYDEQNNRLGIGNTTPTEALDVTGNVKFSGALMPNNLSGTSGQFLTSAGGGTAPTWTTFDTSNIANFYQKIQSLFGATAPVTYSNGLIGITQATTSTNGYLSSTDWNTFNNKANASSTWNLNGNNVTSVQSLGTTSNYDFPLITNNTEVMRLSAGGNVGIGAAVVDGSNAERLLVDGGTTSYNVISGKGDLNNYLQLNIKNRNAGTAASSDVVATNDAGDEENGINYVDMGVNSSGNTSTGVLGGANTTYLYSTGADFSIGNSIAGNNLILFTGGTASSNERMRINGNGNVGVGITNPTQKLDVSGNFKLTGAFMPGNSAGTTGQFLTSAGAGISPTWATFDTSSIANFHIKVRSELSAGTGINYNNTTGIISNSGVTSLNGNTGALTMDTGYISNFYQKVRSLTTSTAPITLTNGLVGITQSTTSTNGYLSSTDWNTFNNKASAANTWTLGGNSVASAQNIGTTSNFDFPFITNNTEKMRLTSGGNLGLGLSVPTAVLHLKAGTATAGTAPIKFTSGALLTTAEAGAEEFLTDKFYGTITTGAARKEFTLNETSLTSTRVAFANASGRLTDLAAFTYNTNRLSPTYITLSAGAAAAGSAPLIFTSGVSLTTPVAGAMEFTTDNPTFTITTGAARKQFTLNDAALTSGRVPYTTTNGRLIDNASMTYAASRLSPTYLTLAAGTAAAGTAPLVFTSGTNLTAPIAGAVEFDGAHFYGTVGATRYQLDQQAGTTYTGSNGITLSGTDFRNNLITGIAGGQTVIGGTASGNALTLTSTSHVIKGKILFGSSAYDEQNNRLGIGNTTPTEALDVTGNVKFSGALMPNNLSGTSGQFLTSAGGGTAPTWTTFDTSNIANFYQKIQSLFGATAPVTYSNGLIGITQATTSTNGYLSSTDWNTFNNKANASSTWNLNGNNVTSVQSLGTTSNYDFPLITNNTEVMRLSAGGNVGIGAAVVDGSNAERLLVDGGTTSYNVISGKGDLNNYLQLNIKNRNAGTAASSDVVATNDAGDEENGINYVDMGVNSSGNTSTGVLGGANTTYLYSTGADFSIGNSIAGNNLILFTGGTASSNERMRINGNGNVGIGITNPTAVLHLKAGTATASTSPLKFTSGTLLTAAEAGAEEFLTDKFYGTITTGAARKEFTLNDAALTSGRVPFATTNGRLTDLAAFTYATNRLSPTYITLGAGAAAAGSAPLVFTSGTSLTSPVAGAMEFTTDNPTFTITTGAARKQFTLNDAALTSGRVPYTTTNGRLIDNASMTYAASRLSPTYLTLAAGTAAVGTAPLVFTSGTNLTTPTAGAMEFDGTHFYGTVGATRYQLDQQFATTWLVGGNNVASLQNIGTTSNFDLPFITNNTEKMRLTASGSVGIGTTAPTSTFDVNGSFSAAITTTTTNLTLNATHYTVIITGGTPVITLPAASGCSGRMYIIANQTAGSRTISPSFISNDGSVVSTQGGKTSITLQSDGTNWYRVQ